MLLRLTVMIKQAGDHLSLLIDLLVELVLAEEQGGVEVIKAFAVALLLRLCHGRPVVAKAHLVAEYRQVHCVLHLLQVLEVEDVALRVDARGDHVADRRVCVFIHYIN